MTAAEQRIGDIGAIGRRALAVSAELCREVAERRTTDGPPFRQALRLLGEQTSDLVELARGLDPAVAAADADDYFDRCLAAEPRLRAVAAGLTLSLERARRQQLTLEQDARVLGAVREDLDTGAQLAAAMDLDSEGSPDALAAIRGRRHDLIVQLAIVDQAIAALRASSEPAKRLVEAVDQARFETVQALRAVSLAARQLARSRVIIERIRAESVAVAALVGGTDERPARAQPPAATAAGQWQALAAAWHRVQRSAAAIEALGLAAEI